MDLELRILVNLTRVLNNYYWYSRWGSSSADHILVILIVNQMYFSFKIFDRHEGRVGAWGWSKGGEKGGGRVQHTAD